MVISQTSRSEVRDTSGATAMAVTTGRPEGQDGRVAATLRNTTVIAAVQGFVSADPPCRKLCVAKIRRGIPR
jgi:hypothetical protein